MLNVVKPAILCLAALVPLSLLAQVPEGPPAAPPDTNTAAPKDKTERVNVDDQKIARFAQAYVAVEEIQRETAEKLSEVTDSRAVSELKLESDKKVNQAIVRAGLQPAEFDSVAHQMTTDPGLRTRIAAAVANRRGL